MICAGIDAGSRTIKIVLIETDTRRVITKAVTDQGVEQDKLASQLFQRLLKSSGLGRQDVGRIAATGYGRNAISFADTTITEITCHAVGVRRLVPNAMTVIDIGGEDSKLIRLDKAGRVRDFAMNDRCAAGTGRFFEVIARRLGVNISSLGQLAAKSRRPAPISSMCVVFAETEIIGLLACGAAREDIIDLPIVFTGGVAMVSGMDTALRSALGQAVTVSPDPQMTGALGAAILAAKQITPY